MSWPALIPPSVLLCACAGAWTAETPPTIPPPVAASTDSPAAAPTKATAASAGYSFTTNQQLRYVYELKQDTSFDSAGDALAYSTIMVWSFVAMPTTVTSERVELGVTILAIKASMSGPGSHHEIDTAHPTSEAQKDPLFGHLFALDGAGLVVALDPRDGRVLSVQGGDAIAAAIAKRDTRFGPGEASPQEAQAKAAYSSEALTRMWGEMLALPTSGPQIVPLGPPFSGALERRWSGMAYTLGLPTGVDHLDLAMGREPVAVAGAVTAVVGKGSVAPANGAPGAAEGELAFVLTLTALTQPVVEKQVLHWRLSQAKP